MKRTRRIEIVRYTRRVTVSSESDASDRAEGAAIDILRENLGDAAPEESRHVIDAGDATAPHVPLLRRLLRLPPVQESSPSRSENENTKKENEP